MKLVKTWLFLAAALLCGSMSASAATQYNFTLDPDRSGTGYWDVTLTMTDPLFWTYTIEANAVNPPSRNVYSMSVLVVGVPTTQGGIVSTLGVTATVGTNLGWTVVDDGDGRNFSASVSLSGAQDLFRNGSNNLSGTLSLGAPAPFLWLDIELNNYNWSGHIVVPIPPNTVPIPAAGYLMMTGLGGLAAVARRRKAA